MCSLNDFFRFRCSALLTLPVFLWACGSESEPPPPITCDAFEQCLGSDVTVNRLRCPDRIDDPDCGTVYRKWLECYSTHCSPEAGAEAGRDPCDALLEDWQLCNATHPSDAAAD